MKTKVLFFIAASLLAFCQVFSQNNTNLGTNAGNAGGWNTSIGNNAGTVVTGSSNTFLGNAAGVHNTSGYNNTIVGGGSGMWLTTGSNNVMIGKNSGDNTTSGSGNVFIGAYSGPSSSTASNKLYIDDGMGTYPLIYGDFATKAIGLGTTSPGSYRLYVGGTAYATGLWVGSDRRFKQDIKNLEGSLEKISNIQGVSYRFVKNDSTAGKKFAEGTQLGLIAQDIQGTFPELVHEDEDGYLAVNYQGMIPVLLEAIKELKGRLQSAELKLSREVENTQTTLSQRVTLGKLHQNVPNPSGSSTRIAYELSETTSDGMLYIFDLQGLSMASYPVSEKQGEITIPAGQLQPGLYHYSLVVSGTIVDTKKMILTK